jgi:hypothetical protein
MTVILGYINSNETNNISAIFSDNVETDGEVRKIVDKIRIVDNRFVLGFLGLGLVDWIVDDWIKYSEEDDNFRKAFSSIEELSKNIETEINFCIDSLKTEEKIPTIYYERFCNYPSGIVLLDNKEQKLYYLELGRILMTHCEIKLQELEKGFIYEFGISATNTNEGFIKKYYYCFDKEETKRFIGEHIRELHSIHPKEIGLLGCHFLKIDENSSFVSCF